MQKLTVEGNGVMFYIMKLIKIYTTHIYSDVVLCVNSLMKQTELCVFTKLQCVWAMHLFFYYPYILKLSYLFIYILFNEAVSSWD
jgi:hypothetical protein